MSERLCFCLHIAKPQPGLIRPVKVCVGQIGTAQVGSNQFCIFKATVAEVSRAKVSTYEICLV